MKYEDHKMKIFAFSRAGIVWTVLLADTVFPAESAGGKQKESAGSSYMTGGIGCTLHTQAVLNQRKYGREPDLWDRRHENTPKKSAERQTLRVVKYRNGGCSGFEPDFLLFTQRTTFQTVFSAYAIFFILPLNRLAVK